MRRTFVDQIGAQDQYDWTEDDLEPDDDDFEDENGLADEIEGGEDDDGNGDATPGDTAGPKPSD